ncbi:hypothetical protein ST47_g5369 [Ascochyta rabiei]|uniref:Uncharacterized protein n=1 Tax=Didymella rabiei TaxID=5454 RepID=A0A163E391_DIDRA|nr:hypothetical protein ST47_g5369 [Ascochyta rabiei]
MGFAPSQIVMDEGKMGSSMALCPEMHQQPSNTATQSVNEYASSAGLQHIIMRRNVPWKKRLFGALCLAGPEMASNPPLCVYLPVLYRSQALQQQQHVLPGMDSVDSALANARMR